MSDDLVTWLRAQLDDDERWARVAKGVHWQWVYGETDEVVTPDPVIHEHLTARNRYGEEVVIRMDLRSVEREGTSCGELPVAWPLSAAEEVDPSAGGHIVRHDPARVLAEVDAKRRLLEQFRLRGNAVRGLVQPSTGGVWDDLLRMLALPYADRPGYRKEWVP